MPISGSFYYNSVLVEVLKGKDLLCKATATERVQTDVREMLQITRCEKFVSTVNRPNLFYEVYTRLYYCRHGCSRVSFVDDLAASYKDLEVQYHEYVLVTISIWEGHITLNVSFVWHS